MRAARFHNSRQRQPRPSARAACVILTLAGSEEGWGGRSGGSGVTGVAALLVRVDQI